jgi:hypothetical protein
MTATDELRLRPPAPADVEARRAHAELAEDGNAASQPVIIRCGGEYCDTRNDHAGRRSAATGSPDGVSLPAGR